jgi:hypothetical protein
MFDASWFFRTAVRRESPNAHPLPDEASVCGRGQESGAESGEERLAERSRSETPPLSTDGSTPLMRSN